MSLARLLLSGTLIAGGLILGAFTLLGYLDPNWPRQGMRAAAMQPSEPPVADPLKSRNRFVAGRTEAPRPPRPVAKTSEKPSRTEEAKRVKAHAKSAAKKAAKKKLAEKAKPPPQQASVQWPWNLFSN
jgi:hypothetical protein